MRILRIHNYYRSSSPSGENAIFDGEGTILRNAGAEVEEFTRRNDEISILRLWKVVGPVDLPVVWSQSVYRELTDRLRSYLPDVVHVHNIFPLLTPAVYHACRDAGVPVVQTVHNFRFACANGMFLRNGEICERCIHGSRIWALLYGCYRRSRTATVPWFLADQIHSKWLRSFDLITRFIAPTEFVASKMLEAGFTKDRIRIKPHFVGEPPNIKTKKDNSFVYVGRLERYKGLDVLLAAARKLRRSEFIIVGSGPDEKWLSKERTENMKMVGVLGHEAVLETISRARALLFPSLCYETFGLAIAEAYSVGVPVIGSDIGAVREAVIHEHTGLLIKPGSVDDLVCACRRLADDDEAAKCMGANARRQYEKEYTEEKSRIELLKIYQEAIDNSRIS